MRYSFGRIFNVALIVGTAIGILQPAFFTDIGLTQIIVSIFHPQWTQEYLMKLLVTLTFLASCYALITTMVYRDTPITVISTEIVAKFIKADGSEVEIQRTQLLRANQPNVNAYISIHGASSEKGHAPHDRITVSAHGYPNGIADTSEIFGGTRYFDLFHRFTGGLPYKWYMPLVPIWALNREYDRILPLFRRNIVSRTTTMVWIDEYNIPKPLMDFRFTSGIYRHHYISITLLGIKAN